MEQLFFDVTIIITQFQTLEITLKSLLSGMFIVSHHSQSQTQLNVSQTDIKKLFIPIAQNSKRMEAIRDSYFYVIHHYSHTQFQIQQNHLEIVPFRNVYRHYHSQTLKSMQSSIIFKSDHHHLHSVINEISQQLLFSEYFLLLSFTIPAAVKFL
jgi:aspartyl aminopeptidase